MTDDENNDPPDIEIPDDHDSASVGCLAMLVMGVIVLGSILRGMM